MNHIYKILDETKDHFEADGITNKVSFGDNYKVDNDKTTAFPWDHFNILDIEYLDKVLVFRIAVLCVDVVNEAKQVDQNNDFYGSDNLHDVLNTEFLVITKYINSLRRGDLYEENIRLLEDPVIEMFTDHEDNMVAGWGGELRIQMINDISIC